jgi:hypothetical protein
MDSHLKLLISKHNKFIAYKNKDDLYIVRFDYYSWKINEEYQNNEPVDEINNQHLFWGTKDELFQLIEAGFGGSKNEAKISIYHRDTVYTVSYNKDTLNLYSNYKKIYDMNYNVTDIQFDIIDEYFTISEVEKNELYESIKSGLTKLTLLSKTATVPEYLLKLKDENKYLYIRRPQFFSFYDGWKLYIFENGGYIVEDCTDVQRYRDGGSTYIFTSNRNTLSLPFRGFSRDNSNNWNYNNKNVISLLDNPKHIDFNGFPTDLENMIKEDLENTVKKCPMIEYYL